MPQLKVEKQRNPLEKVLERTSLSLSSQHHQDYSAIVQSACKVISGLLSKLKLLPIDGQMKELKQGQSVH